ncbi:MAG: hypothetical protein OEU09_17580 [Rhodospirillales bacterium]|nr:hypothetical protein [Rhodospirillales bacterium]MDH3913101.1 hypothetical protein [Rhodospirillales bacterium]MDH3917831.1 hypothetical protein [Rhodospirillales bacterium]MDH3967410.1 hypothetical protein [Rhodospirillales bacterium]
MATQYLKRAAMTAASGEADVRMLCEIEAGGAAAGISRLEGMEGHARSGDCRLAKYFPDRDFNLTGT